MIHQLLTLTRPLIVLDTETTGTDTAKDRIVEIGFQVWDTTGMTKEWRSLVNPGIPIPAAATKVHGVTDEHVVLGCRLCGRTAMTHHDSGGTCPEFKPVPRFKDLAANLAKGFADCDWAGQNVRYDLRMTAAEMQRAGQPWSYAGARIIDSSRLEALAIPRSLSDLHEKYTGAKHDGAHGALSDVRASTTVIAYQLQTHAALPRDLDALHAAQWPNLIDSDGRFKWVDGVPCIAFGKWNGKPMKSVDRSYWDWICANEFSTEVKAIASQAKLGKFPIKQS